MKQTAFKYWFLAWLTFWPLNWMRYVIPKFRLTFTGLHCVIMDRDGSASWPTGFRFPEGARDFSLLHSFETSSGGHPPSDLAGTGYSYLGGKAAEV
jgi:hypothetical protein